LTWKGDQHGKPYVEASPGPLEHSRTAK
jgi:hypothetical protein